jgi:putative peptidoglycan lipid II flippase
LAPQLVQLIYGYGKATNPTELARVAMALRVFTVGITAWCMQPVLMRGFFSLHKTLKPVLIGTVMTALFILLCWLGVNSNVGYLALPWATNIAAILLGICLYFGLEMEVGTLDRDGISSTLLKGLGAASVMGAVGYSLFFFVQIQSKLLLILAMMAVLPTLGWIYFYITKAMGMPESEYLVRAVARLDRRQRPVTQSEAGGD